MIGSIINVIIFMVITSIGYGIYIQKQSGIAFKDAFVKGMSWFPDLVNYIMSFKTKK